MIVVSKGLRLIGEPALGPFGVLEVTGSNPVAPTESKCLADRELRHSPMDGDAT
jgi:hypothetical protein